VTAYVVSPQARQDLIDITDYIAADSLSAALKLRDRLFEAFGQLAEQPGIGHVRDDLIARKAGVKFWPVGSYLVVYRAKQPTIQVVRVLSGYWDISAILAPLGRHV
jgi:plasmid stabilization system protein ParE